MLVPFATKLDEKTIGALDKLSSKTQVPKSRLITKAIDLLVEHYEQIDQDLIFARENRQSVTAPHSHDNGIHDGVLPPVDI